MSQKLVLFPTSPGPSPRPCQQSAQLPFMSSINQRAASLMASKPEGSDPEALSRWWSNWCALGDNISSSSSSESKDHDVATDLPPAPNSSHWKGWWSAEGAASTPTADSTTKALKVTVWGGGAFGERGGWGGESRAKRVAYKCVWLWNHILILLLALLASSHNTRHCHGKMCIAQRP